MDEVTKLVNGEITRQKQEEITVGDGQIVKYLLSEHQFETLGENNEYSSYLGTWTLCLGIIIPMSVEVFSSESLTVKMLIQSCVITLCIGVGAISYFEYRKKRRKAQTTYSRLKEEARIITGRQQQQQ